MEACWLHFGIWRLVGHGFGLVGHGFGLGGWILELGWVDLGGLGVTVSRWFTMGYIVNVGHYGASCTVMPLVFGMWLFYNGRHCKAQTQVEVVGLVCRWRFLVARFTMGAIVKTM